MRKLGKLAGFALAATLAATFAGCSDDNKGTTINSNEWREIPGMNDDERKIEKSLRTLNYSLLGEMAKENPNGNVIYSPLSFNTMLSMIALGAEDETLAQILKAANINNLVTESPARAWAEHNKLILDGIVNLDETAKVNLAYGIWSNPGVELNSDFSSMVDRYFKAHKATVDLSTADGVSEINKWISTNTSGMIKDMVTPMDNTPICFANALYFSGRWRTPFKKSDTRKDTFNNSDATTSKVDMMNLEFEALVNALGSCDFISLPFGYGAFVMEIYVCRKTETVAELIDLLKNGLDPYSNESGYRDKFKLKFSMPKFEITRKYSMDDMLRKSGLGNLVDDPKLGGITDATIRELGFLHGAAIKVEEDGVELAASTVTGGILSPGMLETGILKIDRPFVFIIRERSSATQLCAGFVNKL